MSPPRKPAEKRSDCAIAGTLDIIGDRWTLVVVRDLMFTQKRRFSDLLDNPEGITTNILTERLRRLETAGVVQRQAYQDNPPRYEYTLTDRGNDLFDVIASLISWGNRHVAGTFPVPPEKVDEMDPRKK